MTGAVYNIPHHRVHGGTLRGQVLRWEGVYLPSAKRISSCVGHEDIRTLEKDPGKGQRVYDNDCQHWWQENVRGSCTAKGKGCCRWVALMKNAE